MGNFKSQAELLTFASGFIEERIRAVVKDVKHCVDTEPYAPIPAIIYCFSTVDLLGNLAFRPRQNKGDDTSFRSRSYMETYMRYPNDKTMLLQQIFRHKSVHLAIPNPIYKDAQNRQITWWYLHKDNPLHLQLKQSAPNSEMTIAPCWKIPYDHEFLISITPRVNDIMNSVDDGKGNGYLPDLQKSQALQAIFQDSICEIYRS